MGAWGPEDRGAWKVEVVSLGDRCERGSRGRGRGRVGLDAPSRRFGGGLSDIEIWSRFSESDQGVVLVLVLVLVLVVVLGSS